MGGDGHTHHWAHKFTVNTISENSETKAAAMSRLFTPRAACILFSLLAFYAAWVSCFHSELQEFGYYPGLLGVAAILLGITAVIVGACKSQSSTAWTLITISLQIVCFNVAYTTLTIVRQTDTSSGTWPRDWMQSILNGGLVSSFTLPIFILLPATIYLFMMHRKVSSRFAKLLFASLIACVIATTALTFTISFNLGTIGHV